MFLSIPHLFWHRGLDWTFYSVLSLTESLSATKIDVPPKYFSLYPYISIIYVNSCVIFSMLAKWTVSDLCLSQYEQIWHLKRVMVIFRTCASEFWSKAFDSFLYSACTLLCIGLNTQPHYSSACTLCCYQELDAETLPHLSYIYQ